MFASDTASERATSIEDYQNACTNFIIDISTDYKNWVERYGLTDEETTLRKGSIDSIVETTNSLDLKIWKHNKKSRHNNE